MHWGGIAAMRPDARHALVRCFFAEQDRLRGGPADGLCAPGYTAHLASRQPCNLAEHQAVTAELYAAFPDLRHSIELAVIEGDRAVVLLRLHGSHQGRFRGLAPTGRPVVVAASTLLRLEPGGVAELWTELDEPGLLRQLTDTDPLADAHLLGI